jgi:hypothetical protein
MPLWPSLYPFMPLWSIKPLCPSYMYLYAFMVHKTFMSFLYVLICLYGSKNLYVLPLCTFMPLMVQKTFMFFLYVLLCLYRFKKNLYVLPICTYMPLWFKKNRRRRCKKMTFMFRN